jgi:hypothetical protein
MANDRLNKPKAHPKLIVPEGRQVAEFASQLEEYLHSR